jgi:hypothetical protein
LQETDHSHDLAAAFDLRLAEEAPGSARAHLKAAEFHLRAKRYAECEEEAAKAIDLDPQGDPRVSDALALVAEAAWKAEDMEKFAATLPRLLAPRYLSRRDAAQQRDLRDREKEIEALTRRLALGSARSVADAVTATDAVAAEPADDGTFTVTRSGSTSGNLVVNISARHMHICRQHLDTLFGPGAELTVYRWLYQPGEFAAEQTVTIIGPRRRAIENVRILGPVRKATQAEVSFTDSVALGVPAPCRPSGKIDGTPGCVLVGPAGVVELKKGVIRAERPGCRAGCDSAPNPPEVRATMCSRASTTPLSA